MKFRFLLILALLLPFFLLGGKESMAAPYPPLLEDKVYVYEEGHMPEELVAYLDATAEATDTDLVAYGTAWVRQATGLTALTPFGWGSNVKAKTVGEYWFHIPIPYLSRLNNTGTTLKFVEFCAKTTSVAGAKPISVNLWSHDDMFKAQAITWPNNTGINCLAITPTAAFRQALGLSLKIDFNDTTTIVTLYKAWSRISN